MGAITYLELYRNIVEVTTIFVVFARVFPDQARHLFKGIPALQFGLASWRIAANDTTDFLLHGVKRDGVFDNRVVVF